MADKTNWRDRWSALSTTQKGAVTGLAGVFLILAAVVPTLGQDDSPTAPADSPSPTAGAPASTALPDESPIAPTPAPRRDR